MQKKLYELKKSFTQMAVNHFLVIQTMDAAGKDSLMSMFSVE